MMGLLINRFLDTVLKFIFQFIYIFPILHVSAQFEKILLFHDVFGLAILKFNNPAISEKRVDFLH